MRANPTLLWAIHDAPTRTVNEVAVLAVLVAYAQKYGVAWPNYRTIARKARISKSSVIRTIKALEARGVIARGEYQRDQGQAVRWVFPAFGGEAAPPHRADGHQYLTRRDIELRRARTG